MIFDVIEVTFYFMKKIYCKQVVVKFRELDNFKHFARTKFRELDNFKHFAREKISRILAKSRNSRNLIPRNLIPIKYV